MTRLRHDRRWWVIAPIGILLVATGLTVLAVLPPTVAVGDPTGQVLAGLSRISSALPKSAHVDHAQDEEPSWDSCSVQGGGPMGWNPASVDLQFSWRGTPAQLFASVGRVLERSGWRSEPASPGGMSSRSWTKTLFKEEPAVADLFSDGTGNWDLRAEAPAELPDLC